MIQLIVNNIKDIVSIFTANLFEPGGDIFFLFFFSILSGWISRWKSCFLWRNKTIANSIMVPMTYSKDTDRQTPRADIFVLEGLLAYLDSKKCKVIRLNIEIVNKAQSVCVYIYLRCYLSKCQSQSKKVSPQGQVCRVLKMGG